MKCSEYIESLYDQFDTDSHASLLEMQLHLAECPDCRSNYHEFEKIVATLKAVPQAKAPATLKAEILAEAARLDATVNPARVIPMASSWKKIAATAAILILLLVTPFLFRKGAGEAKASGLIMIAINASQNIQNYVLHFSVRTKSSEGFEYIDPELPMVQHTLFRTFQASGAWSINKPGREVLFDGKNEYLYIPAAKIVYKGDDRAGFVSWMRQLLDPTTILWKEEDNAEHEGAKVRLFSKNGDTCLNITSKATGDFLNDHLRNQNIGTADSRREYVFDGKTHLLKGLKIYLITSGRETLIFAIDQIEYNRNINPGQFSFTTPPGSEVKTVGDLLPANPDSLQNVSSKDATRIALEDLSRGDFGSHKQLWTEYSRFSLALLTRGYKGIVVVRVGEPFRSVSVSGDIVPYEVKFPNGYIKRFRLVIENKNPAKTWVVKGGL